jgi:hypothetical protein
VNESMGLRERILINSIYVLGLVFFVMGMAMLGLSGAGKYTLDPDVRYEMYGSKIPMSYGYLVSSAILVTLGFALFFVGDKFHKSRTR